MKVIVINRKTKDTDEFSFEKYSVTKIKDVVGAVAAAPPTYFVCLVAEKEEEIDFLSSNFHNIPLPAPPAKRTVWTGDMAIFMILNYPTETG